MTHDPRPSNRRLYAAIAMLMAASITVQAVRDRQWSPFVPPDPTLWLQSGALARRMALGFDNVVADAYWMRAVVYYGGRLRASRGAETRDRPSFELLYPLLDLVTSLDPHFKVAYRFGAIFLAEGYPAGPGRPDQAELLLRRGIERDFGRWEYFHDIGFIHYWWRHDYRTAADWFLKGAAQPGAPEWLKPLAATTLASGGDRNTSRQLWTQLLNSDVEYLKSQAELRLQQLDTMDRIAELTPLLQRFIEREKRTPRSWEEFAAAEGLRTVPTDATGMRFYFDPKVGRIDVSPKSRLWPLPPAPGNSRP